ncbi:UNVERIFIED_CONTAM: hypothetical protein FKN15_064808 [Acipenser sinensis]
MERASNFLQVPWKAAPEQRHSVFRPVQASTPQPFLVFLDFLEEGQSSWHQKASVLSVSKHAAPLASLEGEGALGLVQCPSMDSTIAALVYALMANAGSRRPTSRKRTQPMFRPVVEEILQCSHREREGSRQVAVMLLSHAPVWDKMRCWHPPVTTVTRTVPILTALCGDLRRHLQASAAANNLGCPQGWGNGRRGVPTHQRPGRQFPRNHSKQPPRQAVPQPQQPQQGL